VFGDILPVGHAIPGKSHNQIMDDLQDWIDDNESGFGIVDRYTMGHALGWYAKKKRTPNK
jgi:hypothetical protein